MSGKVIEFLGQQKYRFDFGADGKLYVVIFNAKIPQAELKKLLSSLGNCLYEKMPGAILLYLEQHQFEFSDYIRYVRTFCRFYVFRAAELFLLSIV